VRFTLRLRYEKSGGFKELPRLYKAYPGRVNASAFRRHSSRLAHPSVTARWLHGREAMICQMMADSLPKASEKGGIRRWLPLAAILLATAAFFAFGLEHYLSLEALRANSRLALRAG